jgi:putative transposase
MYRGVKVIRGYKVELDLNNKQRTCLAKHAGTARFTYNWGLQRKIEAYKAGRKTPTAIDLHKELNALKKTELNWMYEVSKCAPQEALRNLDKAYANFFHRVFLKKAGKFTGKVGFPKFKSKKCGLGSFRLTGKIRVQPSRIKLPRLGWLKLKERDYIPTDNIKILSVTISEKAGHWFVSVQVEQESPEPAKEQIEKATGAPIGVDLGIKKMAVCSDSREFENPKTLRKSLKKLRRAQRELSRRSKGGKNREKSRRKIARLHYRIANIRSDAIHKATSSICCLRCTHQDDSETQIRIDEHKANDIVAKTKPQDKRPSVVVIEDLSVKNMLKNHKLARAISDVGFFEFRRQLTYKTVWNGISLLVADRFFPSSKLCSACGAINDKLTLQDREWTCDCGALHDRDRNAAINLSRLVV